MTFAEGHVSGCSVLSVQPSVFFSPFCGEQPLKAVSTFCPRGCFQRLSGKCHISASSCSVTSARRAWFIGIASHSVAPVNKTGGVVRSYSQRSGWSYFMAYTVSNNWAFFFSRKLQTDSHTADWADHRDQISICIFHTEVGAHSCSKASAVNCRPGQV